MISSPSRRVFLKTAAASVAAALAGPLHAKAHCQAPGMDFGVQLYSLAAELSRDLPGTLRAVADAGYRHVELAGFFGLPAAALRAGLDAAGLECVSGHISVRELNDDLAGRIEYAKALGLRYVVTPDLWDEHDWKANAECFNRIGAQVRAAGMRFAFHNHVAELKSVGGVVGYDELLRLTDSELVTMQLDCGWFAVAGLDPVDYLVKHPRRFELLHIKDVEQRSVATGATEPHFTDVGTGAVAWPRVLGAAQTSGVKFGYVEIEAPFKRPPLDSVRDSLAYLRSLPLC